MAQNRPSPRTSPTDGCRRAISRRRGSTTRDAEVAHALEDAVALEHLERRDAGGARERVARVGEAARERDGVEVRGDPRREITTPPSGT